MELCRCVQHFSSIWYLFVLLLSQWCLQSVILLLRIRTQTAQGQQPELLSLLRQKLQAPSSLTDGRKALANNICEVNRESLSLGGVWGILLLTWPWFSTSSWEVLLFCRDSRKLNLRKGGLLDVFPTLSFSLDVWLVGVWEILQVWCPLFKQKHTAYASVNALYTIPYCLTPAIVLSTRC